MGACDPSGTIRIGGALIAPAPNLFQPRKIRVVSGIQSCIACDKPIFRTTLQAGWAFVTCENKRCDAEAWSLAIPPDAPAGHLCAIMGEDQARLVLVKAFPQSATLEPPNLWGYILNPGDEQAWVQVAVRPRERHLHRRSKLSHIITSFLL